MWEEAAIKGVLKERLEIVSALVSSKNATCCWSDCHLWTKIWTTLKINACLFVCFLKRKSRKSLWKYHIPLSYFLAISHHSLFLFTKNVWVEGESKCLKWEFFVILLLLRDQKQTKKWEPIASFYIEILWTNEFGFWIIKHFLKMTHYSRSWASSWAAVHSVPNCSGGMP